MFSSVCFFENLPVFHSHSHLHLDRLKAWRNALVPFCSSSSQVLDSGIKQEEKAKKEVRIILVTVRGLKRFLFFLLKKHF